MQSALWPPSAHGTISQNTTDLLRLNNLKLTLSYPGWRDDFIDAERALLTNPENLEDLHFFKMEEKQRMFTGDRSHERLQKLDSHCFSYPGWQLNVRKAEESHVSHKSGCGFDECLQGMVNKEGIYKGDRLASPNLVKLDRLKRALSYPGWEHDFVNAEKSHLTRPDDFEDFCIFKLVEKQRMYYGDRSHVRLRALDSHRWTYPGWEMDKRIVEEEHVMYKRSPWFERILQAMRNRQCIYNYLQQRTMMAAHASSNSPSNEGGTPSNQQASNCVICLTEPMSHAFIPCGHFCACEMCAFEAFGRSGMCPICRRESDTVTQIFFS